MLVREQAPLARLGHDTVEECARDLPREQPLPILGEDGRVPDRIVHLQADEPAKEQVVVELLQQPASPSTNAGRTAWLCALSAKYISTSRAATAPLISGSITRSP